jgi:hypothetical protein
MPAAAKFVRTTGLYLLNLVVAAVVTDMLASPFLHTASDGTMATMLKRDVVNGLAAFGLGYFVYRRWRQGSSKWVWVAGFCWFGQRAVRLWFAPSPFGILYPDHTVFRQLSGSGCNSEMIQSCSDWIVYTLPLLRTTFYSFGAFCCSIVGKQSFSELAKYALLGTRRDRSDDS